VVIQDVYLLEIRFICAGMRYEALGTFGCSGGVFLYYHAPLTEDEYLHLYSHAMKAALEKSLTIQQAEDVAQDVLVSLWLRTLSPNSPPIRNRTGWIATCARNAAFRVLKSRGRELSLSESSTVRVKGPGSVDWEIDLNTAINKLCQEDQDLFRLRYLKGISVSTIASQMGVSDSTVRRRLWRLKAELIRMLGMD